MIKRLLACLLVLSASAWMPPAEGQLGTKIQLLTTQDTIIRSCGGIGVIDVSSYHRSVVVSTSGSVGDLALTGETRRCSWLTSSKLRECHAGLLEFPEVGDVLQCSTPASSNSCYLSYCARSIAEVAFPAYDSDTNESPCKTPEERLCDGEAI